MQKRTEVDSLGKKELPVEAYYGIQTLRALENFPISGAKVPEVFVFAYAMVKKASSFANIQVGWLDPKVGNVICKACDEVLAGNLLDQILVGVFQAGAGTSFNMNVNEVLANRALEILGKEKGDYAVVNPNDHVNMSQSTNDTFPTAMNIAVLLALKPLLTELNALSKSFDQLSIKYSNVVKSGRTHLQDALPITIGQEFSAYSAAVKDARDQLKIRSKFLGDLALGATAVGTGINSHVDFKKIAIAELSKMTKLPLKSVKNPFKALQSHNAVTSVSGALKELALELIRIANDLRLLNSGPTTGLAEIELPAVQPGSSIMPGKVNPVMAECLDMIAFQIVGNDLALSMAAQAGQLDLNVMTPVMMHNILQSIQLLTDYLPVFRKKCIEGITVDKARCASYIEKNPSLAVFLSPYIGYFEASRIAKQAYEEKRSVKELALEKGLLSPKQADEIFGLDFMLGKKRRTK